MGKQGGLLFLTGGTSSNVRKNVSHTWEQYEFVTGIGARILSAYAAEYSVESVANCLAAGDLWGGFLFAHDACRKSGLYTLPLGSRLETSLLIEYIEYFKVDTIICTPSFAIRLMIGYQNQNMMTSSLRNIFYLGEHFSLKDKEYVYKFNKCMVIKALAYTTQETGVIGFQCSNINDNRYHVCDHVDFYVKSRSLDISKGDLVVTVKYPEGEVLQNYNTQDFVVVEDGISCSCGHDGKTIKLIGRSEYSANVLGTTIDCSEFLSIVNNQLQSSPACLEDFQILLNRYSKKGNVVYVLINKDLKTVLRDWKQHFMQSEFINYIIMAAYRFHLYFVESEKFYRTVMDKRPYSATIDGDEQFITYLKSVNSSDIVVIK